MNIVNKENLQRFFNGLKSKFISSINGQLPDATGALSLTTVPEAENLISSTDQTIQDTFIYRTTGGSASISSGTARLLSIQGNTIRENYIPESWTFSFAYPNESDYGLTAEIIDEGLWREHYSTTGDVTFTWDGFMWGENANPLNCGVNIDGFIGEETLTLISKPDTLTVEVNVDNYKEHAGSSAVDNITYEFICNTVGTEQTLGWFLDNEQITLSDYGVAVNGTLTDEDRIVIEYSGVMTGQVVLSVNYVTEQKGIIYNVKPQSFESTKFNSFNPDNVIVGYGIVENTIVAQANHRLCFCEAVGGLEQGYVAYLPNGTIYNIGFSSVLPEAGGTIDMMGTIDENLGVIAGFNINGYVVVETSTITDLQIHPQWSGKANTEVAAYETPSIITFDYTQIPAWGLVKVNNTYDELNLELQRYIQRIGREAIETGTHAESECIEDTTYRYYVLDVPNIINVEVETDEYTANDYGTEKFIYNTGAVNVPVSCIISYGQNLVDKLRTDVITISDQQLNQNQLKSIYNNLHLINAIYPIGSIYMSTQNVSPATFLGGTWNQIQGRFLLGASSTYTAGTTGGEATHTLTVNEMPSHNHTAQRVGNKLDAGGKIGLAVGQTTYVTYDTNIRFTGGNQPHNNMPPYLAVYMWERTG